MSSHVVIDVRRTFGRPTVQGTRIAPEIIVHTLLDLGYGETVTSYPHLGRDDVLAACWYEARYALPKAWGAKAWRRLRTWLDDNEEKMWAGEDWSGVPLP